MWGKEKNCNDKRLSRMNVDYGQQQEQQHYLQNF